MLDIVCKGPEQFDLAPPRIEPRSHTSQFITSVAEVVERNTVCDNLRATVKCSPSDSRNLRLADHVSGSEQPFDDLGFRFGDGFCVFSRPRLYGAIDPGRTGLDG